VENSSRREEKPWLSQLAGAGTPRFAFFFLRWAPTRSEAGQNRGRIAVLGPRFRASKQPQWPVLSEFLPTRRRGRLRRARKWPRRLAEGLSLRLCPAEDARDNSTPPPPPCPLPPPKCQSPPQSSRDSLSWSHREAQRP
jgi:hypothetical protein